MDLRYYRAMAEASPGISSEMPRPFAYRILGPWLVGLLPLPETAAFYALNSVLSLCVPLVFFLLLVSRGAGAWIAALSAFLFVLSKHQFGISAWNFFQIKDTLSFLCLLACFHAMYSDRRVLFAVSLLAGALAGEMALIMIPVLVCYLWERRAVGARWRDAVFMTLPAAAAFVAARALVPASGGIAPWEAFGMYGGKVRHALVWYGLLVNPFIPVSLLPLVFYRDTIAFIRKNLHLLLYFLLVLASTLFGSNNERLMASAFIAFYMLIARIFESELSHRSRRQALAAAAVVAAAGALSFFHHAMGRYPLPSRSLTIALSGGSLVALTVLAVVWRVGAAGRGAADRSAAS